MKQAAIIMNLQTLRAAVAAAVIVEPRAPWARDLANAIVNNFDGAPLATSRTRIVAATIEYKRAVLNAPFDQAQDEANVNAIIKAYDDAVRAEVSA